MTQITPEEIVAELERSFPLEFRCVVLTVTNRRQTEVIGKQEHIIAQQERALQAQQGEQKSK